MTYHLPSTDLAPSTPSSWETTKHDQETSPEESSDCWILNLNQTNTSSDCDVLLFGLWDLPGDSRDIITVFLILQFIISTITNTLLVTTILYSQNLKIPPNTQLIGVCVNNLLVSLSIVLSCVSLHTQHNAPGRMLSKVITTELLNSFMVFVKTTSFIQYWFSFASIGHYRSKTLKRPALCLPMRERIIARWLSVGWFLSIVSGTFYALAYRHEPPPPSALWWNPFVITVTIAHIRSPIAYLNSEQIFVALLTPVIIWIQMVLVGIFYTYMTRILVAALPAYRFGWFRKRIQPQLDFDNVEPRVEIPFPGSVSFPMERRRDSILSNNDHRIQTVRPVPMPSTFLPADVAVEDDIIMETTCKTKVTHYHQKTSSSSIQSTSGSRRSYVYNHNSVFVNPLNPGNQIRNIQNSSSIQKKASRGRQINNNNETYRRPSLWRPPLLPTLSNSSFHSRRSQDFSDISALGDLHRFEREHRRAVRHFTLRKERVGALGATRNSIIMLVIFVVLTFPIIICSIPGILNGLDIKRQSVILLIVHGIYYLNASVFPVWYLMCSEQVRECVYTLYEDILRALKLRI